MLKKILFTVVICFCFCGLCAQDCKVLLQVAREYKDKREYKIAIEKYNLLEKKCPDYFSETIRSERNYCKKKLDGSRAPSDSQSPTLPGGYSPIPPQPTGLISNTKLYFNAEGGCLNSTNIIRVDLNSWDFSVNKNNQDWLNVEKDGNSLVVTCNSNPSLVERDGEIDVIGEINTTIRVHQERRKASSTTKQTANTDRQKAEVQPILLKISFEAGKTIPSYVNGGKIIGDLEDNPNLILQIEMPWCLNVYKERLIKKRIKHIMDDLSRFGISKERIAPTMPIIDGNEERSACDCASAKSVIRH